MADSHGETAAIRRAISLFTHRHCSRWIHLGDICDADRPDTARACLDLLAGPRAQALCGNNENSLRLNQGRRLDPDLHARLSMLPLILRVGNVILAHSRPFAERLGRSCTLGCMDPGQARAFLDRYPGRHLIRGHGHRPESSLWMDDHWHCDRPVAGQCLRLDARHPRILTCGALTDGWVMIWDRSAATVQFLQMD